MEALGEAHKGGSGEALGAQGLGVESLAIFSGLPEGEAVEGESAKVRVVIRVQDETGSDLLYCLTDMLKMLLSAGKIVLVDGEIIDVIDLNAVTPITTSVKRPIEIVTTTKSFE
ncbi:unnamed protein product [Lactuca saligna]|uniref:Uncharacterized protein n=1 Tax=Lactuca saligna TaxID=75948 RepID=A0AA36DVQ5_LACSI|nr:unnamed protein product [Lactuca saligna]